MRAVAENRLNFCECDCRLGDFYYFFIDYLEN